MQEQFGIRQVRSQLRGWCYMIRKLTRYQMRKMPRIYDYYDYSFRRRLGRSPDYENPQTLTDKLAWLRRYDHDPLYTTLTDKVAVRDWVRERVGDDVLVPCYGVWDRAADIDFSSLPRSFVLKCNHESKFVVICEDKEQLDELYVRAQLATRLKMNYYYRHREFHYRDIKPRIVAEKLLREDSGGEPIDYKFHCFNGVPQYISVIKDRHAATTRASYSLDWELLPFVADAPLPGEQIPRPAQLERMGEIADILAEGLTYCRVDLYAVENKVYFGELTVLSSAGQMIYNPESYDLYWGERLILPVSSDRKQ